MRSVLRSLAVACAALAAPVLAQQFPVKPVKIVVPFAPGGNIDVTSRVVAEAMSRSLGQAVVVENRAGAGGALAAEAVAKSEADGYTLLSTATGTVVINPQLNPSLPYRVKNFSSVGMVAITPLTLEVPAASPHKDFRSLIAYAKANPGKLAVGHSGNGTSNHVIVLLIQNATNTDFNIIAYKGSGPALVDLMGGQIDAMVDQLPSSLQHIRGGKFRALAITSKARARDLPDVPSLGEEGLKDFDVVTSSGLMAPAKTPGAALATLNAALNKALAEPGVQKRFAELGSEPRPGSPQQFDKVLKDEYARTQPLVKAGVLKQE